MLSAMIKYIYIYINTCRHGEPYLLVFCFLLYSLDTYTYINLLIFVYIGKVGHSCHYTCYCNAILTLPTIAGGHALGALFIF